jgi:uncharacterized protein (TIGR00251 family)
MIDIRQTDGGVSFAVRVQPRASRSEIAGEWQGALRVRLTAPPVDDKANDELRRVLAASLNVPLTAVRIAHGLRSRSKRVEIHGVTAAQVRSLVSPQAGPQSRQGTNASH